MKKTTAAALLIGVGGIALAQAQPQENADAARHAADKADSGKPQTALVNTTWAETGVSATGIASSDFLHNEVSKPASKPLFGAKSGTTTAPAAAAADDSLAAEPAAAAAPAPAPAPKKRSGGGGASRPAPSYGGGKDVVVSSGKDIMVEDVLIDPPALFELSVDAGYQSRYYHLGINRVLNAGFQTPADDTDVFYGGVAAHWNGLGGGVKYVRGTTDIETRLSQGNNPIRTEYEELVANIHYTVAILPDGMLNVTGGYRAIFFDEKSFYNAGRFDDFYVTVGNASIPLFRPSVTYHYLDQDSPPGAGANTIAPGAKFHDGQLLVVQVDGQLDLPGMTGLPFDVVYYAQVGFDDELNVQANNWDHDWTQVGVTFPIFVGPVTISPNWSYNERANNFGLALEEHFWGVNVRFDF